jgi:hypothetical protein
VLVRIPANFACMLFWDRAGGNPSSLDEKKCLNPLCRRPFSPARRTQEHCCPECRLEYHDIARRLGYWLLQNAAYSLEDGGFVMSGVLVPLPEEPAQKNGCLSRAGFVVGP